MISRDIATRKDISLIITNFYSKLLEDEFMYPFFHEIVEDGKLNHHLEIITDFWEDILLQTHKYKNNPMRIHLDFHAKMSFSKAHFTTWLKHLTTTIDENFKGVVSENMKNRAQSIAMVMQTKMQLYNS